VGDPLEFRCARPGPTGVYPRAYDQSAEVTHAGHCRETRPSLIRMRIRPAKSTCSPPPEIPHLPPADRPSSRANRQFAASLDEDNCAVSQLRRTIADYPEQPRIDGRRRLIAESKENDARSRPPRRRENVSEIKIECEHDPASRTAFAAISGSGSRISPSSRRWTAS
jgi:hypothetical protein